MFILLLPKGVYPYEYVHDWEKFNEISLPEKLLADVFENFRNMCLEIYELDPAKFLSASGLAWQAASEKVKVKLDLLTDIDMLLMVEKCIRGGIRHSIYGYANANKKYMKDYDKSKESFYIQYWNVNNLYGQAMSQKLPVNNTEWIKNTSQFNEDFMKNYIEESDKGHFLEVDGQYIEKLHELHNDYHLLPKKIEIEKVEKDVANLHDITEYVIHIRNLKKAINHEFVLKKVHKVIKVHQDAWLKPYIDMNTDSRKKVKNDFEKGFLKLMSNAFFEKLWKM